MNKQPDKKGPAFEYLCVDAFLADMVKARALRTAFHLGIIDYIRNKENCSSGDLKKNIECHTRGLDLLLDLLETNHVIEDDKGKIRLSQQFVKALPYGDLMRAKLDFSNFVAPDFTDRFSSLVRDPDSFGPGTRTYDLFAYNRCFDYTPENYNLTKRWMRITTCLTRYEAQACMEFHDFKPYQTIMDIGGNSGEFMLQVCRKYPSISATVFDLPLVCQIGREHVNAEPEAGRIEFIKGNALADPLPKGFDLVSFKSMLHDWPEEKAKHLMQKARESLNQGGELLIFEREAIEFNKTTVPYSMIPFLLFYNSFRSSSFYQDYLRELGFQNIKARSIELDMPFFLVTAVKE